MYYLGYVDDMNIIGTHNEIKGFSSYINMKFEKKDLGKTKYCLDLQIEYLYKAIFVHHSTYLKEGFEEILYGELSLI